MAASLRGGEGNSWDSGRPYVLGITGDDANAKGGIVPARVPQKPQSFRPEPRAGGRGREVFSCGTSEWLFKMSLEEGQGEELFQRQKGAGPACHRVLGWQVGEAKWGEQRLMGCQMLCVRDLISLS